MTRQSNKLPSLDKADAAMVRAAHSAANLAKQHDRPLVLWRDGKVVRIPVDELPTLGDKKFSKLKS